MSVAKSKSRPLIGQAFVLAIDCKMVRTILQLTAKWYGYKIVQIYFYDVGQVQGNEGARLENIVALHLLKRNQFLEDTEGKKLKLCYIRDKEKREIDFVIDEGQKISHLIEVKNSDDQFNTSLNYYAKKLKVLSASQIVLNLKREKHFETFKVLDLHQFLLNLET